MHVGRLHGEHQVTLAQQGIFVNKLVFHLGHRDDTLIFAGDGSQSDFFGFAAAHEEYPVVLTLAQLGNHLLHLLQRISLMPVRRERRDGNPALPLQFVGHNRASGPVTTVIQVSECVGSL